MRGATWWICSASVVVIVIVDVFDHGERVVGIVCGRGRRRRGKQGQGGVSVGGITSCATTTTTSETSFLHHRLSRGGEFFGGGSGIGNIGNGFWCFCLAGAASTPLLQSSSVQKNQETSSAFPQPPPVVAEKIQNQDQEVQTDEVGEDGWVNESTPVRTIHPT